MCDLETLVWGLYGAPTTWFASRLGINAFRTCGGITLFELIGDDAQLCHTPEALEREVSILLMEVQ